MLFRLAYIWLQPLAASIAIPLAILGLLLALAINRFGFSRLAENNIQRIQNLPSNACIFAFQQWTSYPLIAVMITLGITLRNSIIPKPYLAVLYIGIGGGLLLSSSPYYGQMIRHHS